MPFHVTAALLDRGGASSQKCSPSFNVILDGRSSAQYPARGGDRTLHSVAMWEFVAEVSWCWLSWCTRPLSAGEPLRPLFPIERSRRCLLCKKKTDGGEFCLQPWISASLPAPIRSSGMRPFFARPSFALWHPHEEHIHAKCVRKDDA